MNILDALTLVRRRLYDEGGDRPPVNGSPAWVENDANCIWKNQELAGMVLDVVYDIGLRDPVHDDRFTLIVPANKRTFKLPDYVITLDRLRWNADGDPLVRGNLRTMEHVDQAYRTHKSRLEWDGRRHDPDQWRLTQAPAPTHYLTDERRGYVTLYPIPTVAGKVVGRVTRTYVLEGADYGPPALLTADLPEDFAYNRQLKAALVAGACAQAYRKRDSDANAPQLAAECEAELIRLIGSPLNAHTRASHERWSGNTVEIEPKVRYG